MSTTVARVRGPGRPRDARADQAIIDATLELLADVGVADLSIEAVAARAGVGKATVYRRWPSKNALIVDALEQLTDVKPPVLSGTSLRDDLITILESIRRRHTTTRVGQIFPRVIGEVRNQSELMALYQRRVVEPRRARLRELLAEAVERGELSSDIDLDVATDLIVGPLMYRLLTRFGDQGLPRDWSARAVDTLLAGLTPR